MPGGLQFDAPEQAEEPHPYHWTVDLDAGTTKGERMDDRPGEFPRVNDDYATGRTRFLYNSLARDWAFEFNFNGVIKYDLETGRSAAWEHAANETSLPLTFHHPPTLPSFPFSPLSPDGPVSKGGHFTVLFLASLTPL